jgi:hypothetical protein
MSDAWPGFRELGTAIGLTITEVRDSRARREAAREQEDKERKAKEEATSRAAETERQRKAWLGEVQGQFARGRAGPLSEGEAVAALRSKGGRKNPLDDQWV